MAFVPTLHMIVMIPKRNDTAAEVLGIDSEAGTMWLRPLTGSTDAYVAKISDQWAQVKRQQVTEAWWWFGAKGWTGPYVTQDDAYRAQNAESVALLHVSPNWDVSMAAAL